MPATSERVEVYREPSPILGAWAELEQSVPCSIYQTRAWILPWTETLGRRAGIKPFFVLVRDRGGRAMALFHLGLVRRGPLRIATWLGGSDSNFNMPLVHGDLQWTREQLVAILGAAASAVDGDRPDIFELKNQPFAWHNQPNCFALLPHQPSPTAAYGTALPADAESFFAAKLSKDTRKKLRKKEAKLAALGPVGHLVASTADERKRVVDAFIAQKVERFREKNIVSEFGTPEMRAFIETASRPDGTGIELHALTVGERIVAIYGGASHASQWSGMFNAFDGDEDIARSSPGDLLLMRIVSKACTDGIRRFDLGIGEARYKAALCDEAIPLFDAFIATSAKGALFGRYLAARQLAKRAIKKNPRLLAWVRRLQTMRR